jgi:hypothetical protein
MISRSAASQCRQRLMVRFSSVKAIAGHPRRFSQPISPAPGSLPPHAARSATLASKGRLRPALSSRRATWTADHLPPRAAGIPRSSNPPAMARNDSQPAACSSFMVAARSEARSCARARRTARPAALALAVSLAPRSPPSFLPRLLAAASAALVRAEIMPASSSATAAICCSKNLPVAPSIAGKSAKRTSTPDYHELLRKGQIGSFPSLLRSRHSHAPYGGTRLTGSAIVISTRQALCRCACVSKRRRRG